MNIKEIEKITYEEAKENALEALSIKEHECFFMDFSDSGFGYSVLVFKNKKHVFHANDYELHHHRLAEEKGRKALRAFYIKEMHEKLYTDAEMMEPVKSYDEYERKNNFLRNYYIMRYDHETIFFIGTDEEREERIRKIEKRFPYFNPISFSYVSDMEIVKRQEMIAQHLALEFEKLKQDNDVFRDMVKKQLANHEACITCDYTEALASLGFDYDKLSDEKKQIVKEELKKQIDAYCCW